MVEPETTVKLIFNCCSGSDKSGKSTTDHGRGPPTPQRSPKYKPVLSRGLAKLSNSFLLAPPLSTAVERNSSKGQPSHHDRHPKEDPVVNQVPEASTNSFGVKSNTTPGENSNSNGNPNNSPKDSAKKTSLDFKPEPSTSGIAKGQHLSENTQATHVNSRSEDGNSHNSRLDSECDLASSRDSIPGQVTPSIVTVERAAAAKIYLETYFNELLGGALTPRAVRQRLLEADLYKRVGRGGMTPAEQASIWMQFYRRESEHLREVRAMKTRTIRALSAERGSPLECLIDDFELVKVIGKGSFGVVGLVRERGSQNRGSQISSFIGGSDGEYGQETKQVYAMKVIRKSKMLRASQEGHLRAERDFLVASEGSEW